jgi:biopolymer transport protein ExbB
MEMASDISLLGSGGAVLWVIAGLSVVTLAVILWKVWALLKMGAWGGRAAEAVVAAFEANGTVPVGAGGGLRARLARSAIDLVANSGRPEAEVREEAERQARRVLAEARLGLRTLDVVSTVAPLLGLLGTVLGMIAAFQALQSTGSRADPSVLAGGIWEALLTTAAGMAVAIPASLALAWFDAVIDRMAGDLEDLLTRIFLARPPVASRDAG